MIAGADINAHVWYDQAELARLLGLKPKALKEAGIPNARLHRRRQLYLGRDVLAWLDTRKGGRQGLRRVG